MPPDSFTRAVTDFAPDELEAFLESMGQPRFRARQVVRRVWKEGAASYDEMTELPKTLRAELAGRLPARALARVEGGLVSADGATEKTLYRTQDGHELETVWMRVEPPGEARRRLAVCVSSQIGCAYRCAFCASGRGGLVRSLRAAEIAEQAIPPRSVRDAGERPSHIVIMGMGEPMANYDEVLKAVRIVNAEWALGVGARRITISTLGFPDRIDRLAGEGMELELAISLHAPNDGIRKRLCPGAPANIASVTAAADRYSAATGRLVTYEYALVSGVNDSPGQARELGALLRGRRAKVNLIPLNATEGELRRPSREAVRAFSDALRAAGVAATVRHERGADVDAACGQLRWRRLEEAESDEG